MKGNTMFLKCKIEKLDEIIQKAKEVFVGGDMQISGVLISRQLFNDTFGAPIEKNDGTFEECRRLEFSGVSAVIEGNDKQAVIALRCLTEEASKVKAPKK